MLGLLGSLSPEQRAALLLHDVFDYDYDQIAQIIGKSRDKSVSLRRERDAISSSRRPRFQSTHQRRDELAHRFFAATEAPRAISARCSAYDRSAAERPITVGVVACRPRPSGP
jgi:hypothetical protein